MKTKATPGPWRVANRNDNGLYAVFISVLVTDNLEKIPSLAMDAEANAALICTAVNNFEALVELNEQLLAIDSELNKDAESDRIEANIKNRIAALLKACKGGVK